MMSLSQFLRNAPWEDYRYLPVIYDHDFGHMMDMPDLAAKPHVRPLLPDYVRPWRLIPLPKSGKSEVHHDKEGFHVAVDVQHFTPDEITVKNVDDHLVIEAKHDDKEDNHGFISRHFQRRYKLPKDVKSEGITSKLSIDGVLSVHAPKAPVVEGNVRTIPIQTTGLPAVHHVPKPTLATAVAKKQP